MPRRSPGALRAEPARSATDHVSSLRITVCPGLPACDGLHTLLRIDGTELIAATNPELRGLDPEQLLRPGGPLYPADYPRRAGIAYLSDSCGVPECHGLTINIRLHGDRVTWSGLFYQDFDGRLIEHVHYDLGEYLHALETGRADRTWESPQRRLRRLIQQRLDNARPLSRFGVTSWHVAINVEIAEITVTLWFPGERRDGGGQHTFVLALDPGLPENQQVDAVIRALAGSDPRGRLRCFPPSPAR